MDKCTFCGADAVDSRKIWGKTERYCKGHLFYGNLEPKKTPKKRRNV